jgi:hypothetical protein
MSNGRTAVGNDRSRYASSLARRSDDIFGTHTLETVADKMSALTPEAQRKILDENAAKLYRLLEELRVTDRYKNRGMAPRGAPVNTPSARGCDPRWSRCCS